MFLDYQKCKIGTFYTQKIECSFFECKIDDYQKPCLIIIRKIDHYQKIEIADFCLIIINKESASIVFLSVCNEGLNIEQRLQLRVSPTDKS
jgi:hypothetical protein